MLMRGEQAARPEQVNSTPVASELLNRILEVGSGAGSGLEVVREDRFEATADFPTVVGPDALAPVTVATGLGAEQVE